MGQHLPDRLFWAREDADAPADEAICVSRGSDAHSRH
jgi:hypothetical protein